MSESLVVVPEALVKEVSNLYVVDRISRPLGAAGSPKRDLVWEKVASANLPFQEIILELRKALKDAYCYGENMRGLASIMFHRVNNPIANAYLGDLLLARHTDAFNKVREQFSPEGRTVVFEHNQDDQDRWFRDEVGKMFQDLGIEGSQYTSHQIPVIDLDSVSKAILARDLKLTANFPFPMTPSTQPSRILLGKPLI